MPTSNKSVIDTLEVVKTSIIDLNRLTAIKAELDTLKNEQKSTLSHLFNRLSDINYDIKGLESLNNNQKRVLILNEIEINLEDDYAIKILSLIKWYYSSGLSIKKEFITLKNLKNLKKLHKCYTKASIQKIFKITSKEGYNKALEAIINNALSVNMMLQNFKNKELKTPLKPFEGLIVADSKVTYDLPTIDLKAVQAYNGLCYIEGLNAQIAKVA